MTRKLSFVEWLNENCETDFAINEYGSFDHRKNSCDKTAFYYKLSDSHLKNDYFKELKEYKLAEKEIAINKSLETLNKCGIHARLLNHANSHIQAIGKNGVKYSYYATSGTITGYGETSIKGLNWLIKLCKGENNDKSSE